MAFIEHYRFATLALPLLLGEGENTWGIVQGSIAAVVLTVCSVQACRGASVCAHGALNYRVAVSSPVPVA